MHNMRGCFASMNTQSDHHDHRVVNSRSAIKLIYFGSIYLLSINNLKGQCEFNICRFRFFCVDRGGHAEALGLHVARCRLPRRHGGCLLPLVLLKFPETNSPSSLSDFPCSPTRYSKGSPGPSPLLSLIPSPPLPEVK